MTRDKLAKMNAEIEEVRQKKLDAMKMAIRHRGWRRRVFMFFVRFFGWAERFGMKVREDQVRSEFDR